MTRRRVVTVGVIAVLLGAVLVASLAIGSRSVAPAEVWRALVAPDGSEATSIVRSLRVPRTVLGVLVGSGLAVAGVLLQALTRNPIAEPRVLGIGAGASLGVVLAIAVAGVTTPVGYVWFAMASALLAGAAVQAAGRSGDRSPVTLVLAGSALDAALGSIVIGILVTSGQTFDDYRFWLVGALTGRDLGTAGRIAPFVLAGLLIAAFLPRSLDALALGDDVAVGLGHRIGLVKLAAAGSAIVLTGASVAGAGPIAFVGLAVPHLARALVGVAHRWLLPVCALLGPVLVLGADVLGRVVTPPAEVSAGIVTALVGAPVLAWIVVRDRRTA